MKRLTALVSLAVIVGLVISACGGGGDPTATPISTATPQLTATPIPGQATATPAPTPTAQPTATPQPTPTRIPTVTPVPPPSKYGGVVTQGDFDGTASMSFQLGIRNPELGPAHSLSARLIYQPLFQFNSYKGNNLTGVLAESWNFSDSADQVTVQIDPAAVWADDNPVTAQDVTTSLDQYINPPEKFAATGPARGAAVAMESVDIIDERTVRITLKSPDVSFLANLASPDSVIRPSYRTLEQSANDPIGSNAFEIIDVDTDVKFTFVKNPSYWMVDDDGSTLPYLDSVETIVNLSETRAFAAVITGQVGVLNTNWPFGGKSEDEFTSRMPSSRRNSARTSGGASETPLPLMILGCSRR